MRTVLFYGKEVPALDGLGLIKAGIPILLGGGKKVI